MVGGIFVEGWWRPLQTVRTRASEAAASRQSKIKRRRGRRRVTRRSGLYLGHSFSSAARTLGQGSVGASCSGNWTYRQKRNLRPAYLDHGYITTTTIDWQRIVR